MSGRIALSPTQLEAVLQAAALFPTRDRTMLVLGVNTGFRIHELLSLTVGQIWDGVRARDAVEISRAHLKGGQGPRRRSVRGRVVPLNADCAQAIGVYIALRIRAGPVAAREPLFPSREGQGAICAR